MILIKKLKINLKITYKIKTNNLKMNSKSNKLYKIKNNYHWINSKINKTTRLLKNI